MRHEVWPYPLQLERYTLDLLGGARRWLFLASSEEHHLLLGIEGEEGLRCAIVSGEHRSRTADIQHGPGCDLRIEVRERSGRSLSRCQSSVYRSLHVSTAVEKD